MRRVTLLSVSLLCAMLLAAIAAPPASVRPAAALPAAALPAAQPAEPCDWTGVWLPFEGEWRLAQNGTSVSGSYLDGRAFVSGTVEGDMLRGEWKEPPGYSPPFEAGRFTVTMTADCNGFVGTWGLGDAECCNVLSAIRHDDPSPSLAVEVERGTLVVDGQTLPAGATYFPPNCPPPGRSPAEECVTFVLGSETSLKFSCFLNRLVRVLIVMEQVQLSDEDSELLLDIITMELRERCGLTGVRQDAWALDMEVRGGAAHVAGVVEGQTVNVAAGPAAVTAAGPGSLLAGYDPAAGRATFHAYASPLEVQPQGGAAFTLPPYSRVEVTAGGPGPVTALSRLYLPMQQK